MPEDETPSRENHRKLAINCSNLTWNLLDKKDRTKEEDEQDDSYSLCFSFPLG